MKRVSIKVKLLDYTPEPERVVAMAARLCYSASGAEELAERLDEAAVRKMVRKMVKIGHGSTLEHASFTFGVEGVTELNNGTTPKTMKVTAVAPDGTETVFDAVVRIDTPGERGYYVNGGIMQYVLRNLAKA